MKTIVLLFFGSIQLIFSQTKTADPPDLSYEQRIKLSRINDVYIPLNTEDALKELFKLSEEAARDKIKQTTEDIIASKLHFSLGRWILVNWTLEEGSRLSHYYKTKGVTFPDDMIDLLLRAFYRKINQQEINEDDLIKSYKDKRKKEMDEIKKNRKFKILPKPAIKKHLE